MEKTRLQHHAASRQFCQSITQAMLVQPNQQLPAALQQQLQAASSASRRSLHQYIHAEDDTSDSPDAFLWQSTATREELLQFELSQPVGRALSLCLLQHMSVALRQQLLGCGVQALDAHIGAHNLAIEASSVLQALLPAITAHDVRMYLQQCSNANMPHTCAALAYHPALALRLHQLGWPVECCLAEMQKALLHKLQHPGQTDMLLLHLPAFIPAGLDPTHHLAQMQQEESDQSSLTIARSVASSVESAQMVPLNMEELIQQACSETPKPVTDEAELRRLHQQLCVQLVHEWRLHSAKLRTLLKAALSTPNNNARKELRIIAGYLDLEPQQQQQLAASSTAAEVMSSQ